MSEGLDEGASDTRLDDPFGQNMLLVEALPIVAGCTWHRY